MPFFYRTKESCCFYLTSNLVDQHLFQIKGSGEGNHGLTTPHNFRRYFQLQKLEFVVSLHNNLSLRIYKIMTDFAESFLEYFCRRSFATDFYNCSISSYLFHFHVLHSILCDYVCICLLNTFTSLFNSFCRKCEK